MAIDKKLIQKLREITGLGMMDCKKALEANGGDIEKAIDDLRKKGAAVAAKRADKETTEGVVYAYIHPGSKMGVLIELNCETDFVANTPDVHKLAQDLGLHIAAMKPLYLSPDDVDTKLIEHETGIFKEQLANAGKPEKIIDQIIKGKIQKFKSDICLLSQPFVKNDQMTVEEAVKEVIGKVGESIKIKQFSRFEVGN